MSETLPLVDRIHERALEASSRYRRCEGELIEILQLADQHNVYLERGHPSLFQYVTRELGLSENAAYTLILVSRKAAEVPELKQKIQQGTITLSNAKRIAPILDSENKSAWIAKAQALTQKELEREIARTRPQILTPERTRYVTENRLRLELGIFESDLEKLRRAQDMLSQSKQRSVTLEETVIALTLEYLTRHDPVEKALRAQKQTKAVKTQVLRPVATRRSIPASVLHEVNQRDQGRCAFVLPNGARCTGSRFIEIHHRVPLSVGGPDTPENLVTLCSAHHRWIHDDP